jgi:lantibiotic modifying enzyme
MAARRPPADADSSGIRLMGARNSDTYRSVAEAAWSWVIGQVRCADGPWIPWARTDPADTEPPWDRDGMHSGVGGLAHVLAEIRLARDWTDAESQLAESIAGRLRAATPESQDVTYFDGLSSMIGSLVALGAGSDGVSSAVDRLLMLATPDGWPQTTIGAPRYGAGARVNDLTLGTAGVLVAALWARRHGVTAGQLLAEQAAQVLLAEAEPQPTGLSWRFVPRRFHVDDPDQAAEMPNLTHGLAGIVAALAAAGTDLDRPDLVAAARSGAEHLVTLADQSRGGFVIPRTVPHTNKDLDEVTFNWCHGPAGTSTAFLALDRAGVDDIAGLEPLDWQRRCLHSVRTSGVPDRLHPGFWDNDGRCCGTAGVGDVFLDAWQRTGVEDDLEFALQLADTLVDRAVREGEHAWWHFIEHRADPPLLPPGVGWMQGAAGIAAYLFRASRVVDDPTGAAALPRMDTWWTLPEPAALQ